MNVKQFLADLPQNEGDHAEFVTGPLSPWGTFFPVERIAITVCAFLNGAGGRVFIGIADDGSPRGLSDAGLLRTRLEKALLRLISPSALWTITLIQVEEKDVLVVEVPEGMDKPYVSRGAIYLRRGSKSGPATRDEISTLIQQNVIASQRWERRVALGVDFEDLDRKLIGATVRMAAKSGRWTGSVRDPLQFMHDLGLMANGSVTNAALVLYGKHPTQLIPQARVRLLVSAAGKTGGEYAIDRMFEGCLLRIAEDLPEVLMMYAGGATSSFSSSNWQRTDRALFPAQDALREGVMNALVHRDYESNATITISIQPGLLQIVNPGGLPSELRPADLKRSHLSFPRNPDIAHLCYLHRLIEKVGRGTQRIVEACRQFHLREPRWTTSQAETSLTLFSSTVVSEGLNTRQARILSLLEKHRDMSATEVVDALEGRVTTRTVRSDFNLLVGLGWVSTQGRGPSTRYHFQRSPA